MRSRFLFTLVAVFTAVLLHAQSQTGSNPPAAGQASSDSGYIAAQDNPQSESPATPSDPSTPWLPVMINGESPIPAFSGELERGNTLRGGMSFSSGYDDNAALENGKAVDNVSYSFAPSISLQQSQARALWDLSYNPGFVVNQRVSELNSNTQAAGLNFQYRFSQYLTFRAHDNFSFTNSPFSDPTTEADSAPGSVLHPADASVLTPFARRVSNLGGVDLIYRAGEGTIIGGSGSSYLLNYDNLGGGPGIALIDTRISGGDAFYSHRLVPNQWIGLTYSFQRLDFNGGVEQTDSNSALLFYTITPRAHLTLSLFGGASYSQTTGQVAVISTLPLTASTQQWLPSAGVIVGWQGIRTGVSATFSRRVDGGGGLLGTVDRYNGSFEVRRQFAPRWMGTIGLLYDDDHPIDLTSEGTFRTLSATAGVQRQVGQNWTVGLNYSRVHQDYGIVSAAQLFPDHNRALLSISYFFSRPLGK